MNAAKLPDEPESGDDAARLRAAIGAFGAKVAPGDPEAGEEWTALLRVLFEAGRQDLPLGRLLEGHVDASQILCRLGHAVPAGAVLGVWNAEAPGWRLARGDDGTITGGKTYASGVDVLTHALVTTNAGTAKVQLYLVDLSDAPPQVDRDWWRVRGMARSRSHRVSWDDARAARIGGSGDYERAPWFFTGALRFVAVQAGGIAGLRDAVRDALVAGGRANDPVQAQRLSRIHMNAQSAISLALETGRALPSVSAPTGMALVSNARNAVYAFAEDTIGEAARALGTASYFEDHPAARHMADLAMYIRQPGPDAQHARVARAVAEGALDVVA